MIGRRRGEQRDSPCIPFWAASLWLFSCCVVRKSKLFLRSGFILNPLNPCGLEGEKLDHWTFGREPHFLPGLLAGWSGGLVGASNIKAPFRPPGVLYFFFSIHLSLWRAPGLFIISLSPTLMFYYAHSATASLRGYKCGVISSGRLLITSGGSIQLG